MTCDGAAPLIAAAADGLIDEPRCARLDAHLRECARCKAALDDQIAVREWLASTPPPAVSSGFHASVNARIDDSEGLMGIADFRRWTLRLAPLAALLVLAAWLGVGFAIVPATSVAPAPSAPATATFMPSRAADWQRSVSGDALLEAALLPGRAGEGDVR